MLSVMLAVVAAFVLADDADLYSTRVRFGKGNVPVVTVGLMDGQSRIVISGAGALRILTSGPGGPEVKTAGGRWTATIQAGAPARIAWRVRLATLQAGDLERIRKTRAEWKARNVATRTQELGTVFGFFGKVLDTRELVVTTQTQYATRAEAETAATRFGVQHGVETGVQPVVLARATGRVALTDGHTTVTAQDVLWLAPASEDGVLTVHGVEHGRGFDWHGREDRRFRGLLYVTVDSGGKLAVANMVPAETLLRGLVPAEIFPSAPLAALEAQAVSARGHLLAKIGKRHLADPFLLCSDVHCQVYAGVGKEDPRTTRAVKDTQGLLLFAADGLVGTVYSACCGGHTESNENVWGTSSDPSLRGRPDGDPGPGGPSDEAVRRWLGSSSKAFCGRTHLARKSFRWVRDVAPAVIARELRARRKEVGTPRRLQVTRRGVSGRATSLKITGTRGTADVTGELEIRKVLGGARSSLFVVDPVPASGDPTAFRLTGGGFGHGVGMCQMGAIGRAEAGQTFRQILAHYFGGAKVERIY